MKNQVPDIWKLVWQERPQIMVMITNLTEAGKGKCEQYWPSSENSKEAFGPFTITMLEMQVLPNYIFRKMMIQVSPFFVATCP